MVHLQRPGLDLKAFDHPYIARHRDKYRAQGHEVWALDLTHDLGIPVFVALSRRTDDRGEQISLGFGAHLDPEIALLRALTELNQMNPPPAGDGAHQTWRREATLANQPYLVPAPKLPLGGPSTFAPQASGDIAQDIATCRALIESRGLELIVLDQSRPEVGTPVVKVIVPGLRHFWARFGPGRLYDMPVALGWLPCKLAEDELNPSAVFL